MPEDFLDGAGLYSSFPNACQMICDECNAELLKSIFRFMVAFIILSLTYATTTPIIESSAMKEGFQSQESWVLLIGPHPSGQVCLHSGLRVEELPSGVHSRVLSPGWSSSSTTCLAAVFPALGVAHFLHLEPWNLLTSLLSSLF